jgi:hypothetical protein
MTNDAIDRLRVDARQLHDVLRRQARRPFVLEITGTPKAGKTTLIALLEDFLRKCGWHVHVLEERAGICPLPMKGHFFFNTWTTGTMLAGLLDAVDRDDDLVILDRGLLDALIWLEVQSNEGQVSSAEAKTFEDFVLIERWRRLSDATCVIELDPLTAMARENERRLLPRRGSIMNEARLGAFNQALANVLTRHGHAFDVVKFKNDRDAKTGAADLIATLLTQVRSWVDKPIAVVPRSAAERHVPETTLDWSEVDVPALSKLIEYRLRSEVESNDEWVQLLACGAQVFNGEVFLSVRRRQRTKLQSARDNSGRLWQGCHIEQPESGPLSLDEVQRQLLRRLQTDLHLGTPSGHLQPLGLIWKKDGDDKRHLGVVFKVSVEEKIANFLDEKEFRTNGRGHLVESRFVSLRELASGKPPPEGYTLEPWSRAFLEKKWLP